MGATNRWAREGGVIDEILVENMARNPEGNALIFDSVLLEKVVDEPNITLLLNTAAFEVEKAAPDTISAVRAFCSQNSTLYEICAPLFCDASGDGIIGFLAGAAFRMGAESSAEFGEKFAPSKDYVELLGHSMYFYSKDTGRPVKFVPPSFALQNIEEEIPRFRSFNTKTDGCRLWWIEYGGRLDTVHDTEKIKWELWKVVYGVWNYIKNSGKFPDAENLTLEWVSHIPGKRESRRFEGDYMLRQQDVIEQKQHFDAVAFGGWALDLHPADGVYSEKPGCTHWRMKGIYQIPYRCLYSQNISNLFLAGRIISVTHAAYGSSRVMSTLSHAAQAVALAAKLCHESQLLPRDISDANLVRKLQLELWRTGQHIPQFALRDADDLAQKANISASSEFKLASLPANGEAIALDTARAQMLPVPTGRAPQVTFFVDADEATQLKIQLCASSKKENHTPDAVLGTRAIDLPAGENQRVTFDFDATVEEPRYLFYCLMKNESARVRLSDARLTGVLSVAYNYTQDPTQQSGHQNAWTEHGSHDIGVETFEIWTPQRRPAGKNFACEITPALEVFGARNITNGIQRPTNQPNAWVADFDDKEPTLTFNWDTPKSISRVELFFDTDYDHPMESVLMGHPEREMPFCLRDYRLRAGGEVIFEKRGNHQTRNTIQLEKPVNTNELSIEILAMNGEAPAAVFEVRCYA
jgi:hypothetical protein